MTSPSILRQYTCGAAALLSLLGGTVAVLGQPAAKTKGPTATPASTSTPAPSPDESDVHTDYASSSVEEGQTPLTDSFDFNRREWRLQKRRDAFRDTEFKFNLRMFYFDRNKFDGSESQALAIGGWAGFKTGYFLDHVSFGITGYTSQHLSGADDKDGSGLLAPGQEGYSVLGELYADIRIVDNLNLYVGRKEFDSPYINRNDTRMTPNTFEAIVLQGKAKLGEGGATLKYGLGYFDQIKERNSDEFVSMAKVAGATVDRGVYTAGALYEKGKFSIGAIDYYSPDVINIAYAETKVELPLGADWALRLALQFTDQRSVGNNLLKGEDFTAQQFGLKVELPVKSALFTVAYTQTATGTNMQSPWSGYPGYTSVQVQDFNRAGEGAFLVRAGYDFTTIKGLSAYALGVFGTSPDDVGQYRQNEFDLNLQWAPPEGALKGLSARVRYAIVQQDGGNVDDLEDFRVILNYAFQF